MRRQLTERIELLCYCLPGVNTVPADSFSFSHHHQHHCRRHIMYLGIIVLAFDVFYHVVLSLLVHHILQLQFKLYTNCTKLCRAVILQKTN